MRMLLQDLQKNKKLIVDLFQKCGREELKFIVRTGLWGGFVLGLLQMAVWLVWSPWWSLAAGGALVGYVTDWFALKIMFEPVEPLFTWGKFKCQGFFLQRQAEVSGNILCTLEENILSLLTYNTTQYVLTNKT